MFEVNCLIVPMVAPLPPQHAYFVLDKQSNITQQKDTVIVTLVLDLGDCQPGFNTDAIKVTPHLSL